MPNHHHSGHRDRHRARFREAPNTFADHELLELLLFYAIPQKDTNSLAHELIYRFGSLGGVLNASEEELAEVPGMGKVSAAMFPVLRDLFRRCYEEGVNEKLPRKADRREISRRVAEAYVGRYMGRSDEEVFLVGVNSRGSICGGFVAGQGDFASAEINPRNVFRFLCDRKPRYGILLHNHPSGVALPSKEDFVATKSIGDLLQFFGVELIDHVVYDPGGDYMSLLESGYMDGRPPDEFIVSVSGTVPPVVEAVRLILGQPDSIETLTKM